VSKNYELLQQADFGLGSAREWATESRPATPQEAVDALSQDVSFVEPTLREEALKLLQRLFLDSKQSSSKAVLFAPIDTSRGCDWLSVLTAKLLAKSVSGSICLAEGNLRSPSLSHALGVDPERGLVDAAQQQGSIKEFARRVGPENLWLLSAGAPAQDAAVLLNSDRMKNRICELRTEFDYLVMNAPPLSGFADALLLGQWLDGVVLVLEANSTRREAAVRIVESLRSANVSVLGAVLNNRTFPIPAAIYKRL